jgi:hypothetical protein
VGKNIGAELCSSQLGIMPMAGMAPLVVGPPRLFFLLSRKLFPAKLGKVRIPLVTYMT